MPLFATWNTSSSRRGYRGNQGLVRQDSRSASALPRLQVPSLWLYLGDRDVLHSHRRQNVSEIQEMTVGQAIRRVNRHGVIASRFPHPGLTRHDRTSHQEQDQPSRNVSQRPGSLPAFLFDPNGLKIELNFATRGEGRTPQLRRPN